ncbi:MAG: alpha/beta hydrolase [Thermodesulfobacteriota bacterium]|nr:alpha/beta hydrolase [Thermodesulfobacteriota bacterium]
MALFHPRGEVKTSETGTHGIDIMIPVEKDDKIGARFHMAEKQGSNILFFHGNGEIVADYNDLGPLYNKMGINFLPVDYRGYGRSTGRPTVAAMMHDSHTIFHFVNNWLVKHGYTGPMIVMGRSLGSAPALEIADRHKADISGLILESGFAWTEPLLQTLGIDAEMIGFKKKTGFQNVDKIKTFDKPVLIIHATQDHIIPFSHGETLYNACSASDKTLLKIPGANHNDIFIHGLTEYMTAVKALADRLC